ncbi:hypothetical protein S7711_00509 [Stachybotrys chartarum IBT 7711]|uniref:CENP-V/GFA domain-containing protein n=1 Tax=Stachybotrys chartarum (strain CBS 109288 / IBT 7711) TaxID=1280523 RepID=A0A084ATK0_STACB|nr:hypothetical protein S7711_00509 [Stachybotrys chartarum IBT 7711]KFA49761.1 hypothetical protein S40293_01399 [Stachybotrys chartarum IBT 40293]
MASSNKPGTISGGCLCGSIRYSVTFPPGHDFVESNSGALVWTAHRVPLSAITYTSQSTLKKYQATPGMTRGICTECGSFLFWRKESGEAISLSVGCFDKEELQKYGTFLASGKTNLFCSAEIPGATDYLQGDRWRFDNEGEGAELLPKRSS